MFKNSLPCNSDTKFRLSLILYPETPFEHGAPKQRSYPHAIAKQGI